MPSIRHREVMLCCCVIVPALLAGCGPDGPSLDEGGGAALTAAYDPNGVRQIYPTDSSGAQPWTLGYGSWEDRTRGFGDVSGSERKTEVTAAGMVRMTVTATASDCEGETDQGAALRRGYMCSPDDWRDYEWTAYFKVRDSSSDDHDQQFSLFGGGGIHSGHGPRLGCRGSAYIGSYHYKRAEVRFGKESWHVQYDGRPWTEVPGGIDYVKNRSKWLGMKVVKFEFSRGGKRGVRNELWLDLGGIDSSGRPANDWSLTLVEEDHPDAPSWSDEAKRCGAPQDDQIIFWGGPYVTMRWDDTDAAARLMSVREIRAPKSVPAP